MKEKDEHFWIEDVINRLPNELVPDKKDWSSVLSALTKLKTERNNAVVERNELAAQVERLRGAANNLSFGLLHDDDWNPSDHTDKAFSELQDIISETPSQSLDAVKREVAILTLEDYDAALSSFEMTVPEYIEARLS